MGWGARVVRNPNCIDWGRRGARHIQSSATNAFEQIQIYNGTAERGTVNCFWKSRGRGNVCLHVLPGVNIDGNVCLFDIGYASVGVLGGRSCYGVWVACYMLQHQTTSNTRLHSIMPRYGLDGDGSRPQRILIEIEWPMKIHVMRNREVFIHFLSAVTVFFFRPVAPLFHSGFIDYKCWFCYV